MFIATLVGIFKFEELPQEYGPFVIYKASLENKNIDKNEEIAILNIQGTESHHALLLNSYKDTSEIENELKKAGAKLNYNTKKNPGRTFMNDLPIEQTWLILVGLLTDLRKKGIEIPDEVPKNVRLAKSTINFYASGPNNPEMMKELKRINDFLNSVQDILLDIAEEVSSEYKDEWLHKLMMASRGEKVIEKEKTSPRFVVGAPAGFSMARVTFKEPLSEERLNDIAETHGVIIEFEEDDVVAIYGDKDAVKESLKEIASFFNE